MFRIYKHQFGGKPPTFCTHFQKRAVGITTDERGNGVFGFPLRSNNISQATTPTPTAPTAYLLLSGIKSTKIVTAIQPHTNKLHLDYTPTRHHRNTPKRHQPQEDQGPSYPAIKYEVYEYLFLAFLLSMLQRASICSPFSSSTIRTSSGFAILVITTSRIFVSTLSYTPRRKSEAAKEIWSCLILIYFFVRFARNNPQDSPTPVR